MIILEARNLCKRYGNFSALNDINISLECGKVVGLLGPNGSGKTTFLKIINGLLTPEEGDIWIGGERPGEITKQHVSFLPDTTFFPKWMKVTDLIKYYKDFFGDFDEIKARHMLDRLSISEKMKLNQMSKGTLEKAQLIVAMSRNANLYCLDEPIGGVDPATRDFILQTIVQNYRKDSTVIISTHLIADVEPILDEAIFLKNGNIVMHSPVSTIRQYKGKSVDEYFREVFRC